MSELGIIADDLTGASDSGMQFSRLGRNVKVIWDIGRLEQSPTGRSDCKSFVRSGCL